MTWLLHNYFLPTLNPSTPSAAPSQPLRPLAPLLRQYKALMKATTRDATLRVQLRGDIAKATRDLERWIAEAKVASAAAAGALGWEDALPDGDEEDARERWALDRLAEALVQKGGLVPLSKKLAVDSVRLLRVATLTYARVENDCLQGKTPSPSRARRCSSGPHSFLTCNPCILPFRCASSPRSPRTLRSLSQPLKTTRKSSRSLSLLRQMSRKRTRRMTSASQAGQNGSSTVAAMQIQRTRRTFARPPSSASSLL